MASPSELSLDCKPHSYSMLLKAFGDQAADHETQKLEEVLARLEEERFKIDGLKRELPLCMQLLTNGIVFCIFQLFLKLKNKFLIISIIISFDELFKPESWII